MPREDMRLFTFKWCIHFSTSNWTLYAICSIYI